MTSRENLKINQGEPNMFMKPAVNLFETQITKVVDITDN